VSKRETVLGLLEPTRPPATVPAAFFLHFDASCHFGPAAVARHVEFFRATDMDIVKVQYERKFPQLPAITRPEHWRSMPRYGEAFFAPQLEVVDGLVAALKREAVVVVTLYSPFMCAGHAVGEERLLRHLEEDREPVLEGMRIITDSLLTFVRACVRLGVDGFYHSTQGGEKGRLADRRPFDEFVRPFDLAVMREAERSCVFNILHVCDFVGEYDDISRFADYPGHVVSCPLRVAGRPLSLVEAGELFRRPVMGGLDRHGAIATGDAARIRSAVAAALEQAPEGSILGADCTVPADTPWANLRTAIDASHAWRRG
jgi:uroporphyrinogen decarboxylase